MKYSGLLLPEIKSSEKISNSSDNEVDIEVESKIETLGEGVINLQSLAQNLDQNVDQVPESYHNQPMAISVSLNNLEGNPPVENQPLSECKHRSGSLNCLQSQSQAGILIFYILYYIIMTIGLKVNGNKSPTSLPSLNVQVLTHQNLFLNLIL